MQIAERQTFGQYPRCSDKMPEELTRAPPRVSPERYPPRSAQRPRPGCLRRLRDGSALGSLSSMADRLPRPRQAALRRSRAILSLPGALPSALFPRRRRYVREGEIRSSRHPLLFRERERASFFWRNFSFLDLRVVPPEPGKGRLPFPFLPRNPEWKTKTIIRVRKQEFSFKDSNAKLSNASIMLTEKFLTAVFNSETKC